MEDKPKSSKAQQACIARYNAKAYDRITVRVPKGTLDTIKAKTTSVNGLINRLLSDWLKAQPGE